VEKVSGFCMSPWNYVEIVPGGHVYTCCPAYNFGKSLGSLFEKSWEEVWNGPQAQKIREGIINGTFIECDSKKCFSITSGRLNSFLDIENSKQYDNGIISSIKSGSLIADKRPSIVKVGYDTTCNICCPACRKHLVRDGCERNVDLDNFLNHSLVPLLQDAEVLILSGDGEPFASKSYINLMKITGDNYPKIRLNLCTNGTLLDRYAWETCNLEGRVSEIYISIDASTSETYKKVRKGGNFFKLLDNLYFLSEKRRQGNGLNRLVLLFLVCNSNFSEMIDFIELGKDLEVDRVEFCLLNETSRGLTGKEFECEKVWAVDHPRHQMFMSLIQRNELHDPIVRLNFPFP